MQEKRCKNAEAKVICSEGPQREVWNQLQLGSLSGPIKGEERQVVQQR